MRRSTRNLIVSTALFLVPVLLVWGPGCLSAIMLRLDAYRGQPYAVYLDSGHIFYGTLKSINMREIALVDVRSFQRFEVGESTTNTLQEQVSNPITRPENLLVIERTHVLFVEKIGPLAPVLFSGESTR